MQVHERDRKAEMEKKENDKNNCFNKTYSLLSSNDTSKNVTPVVTPVIPVVKPSAQDLNSLNLAQSQTLEDNNFGKSIFGDYEDEELKIDEEGEGGKIFQNTNLNSGKTIFNLFGNYNLNGEIENKNYLYGTNNEKKNYIDYLDDVNSIDFNSSIINEENNNHKDGLFLDY